MVYISQVEVLITLVVIKTSKSKLGCFSFFSCNLSNNIFPNILLEMIDAAPLETIVDKHEEVDRLD